MEGKTLAGPTSTASWLKSTKTGLVGQVEWLPSLAGACLLDLAAYTDMQLRYTVACDVTNARELMPLPCCDLQAWTPHRHNAYQPLVWS